MRRLAIIFLSVAQSSAALADGPFGVNMGADPKNYAACKEVPDRPGQFLCHELPKMHANFYAYAITATPSTGVCGCAGLGRTIQDNGFGDQLRSTADEIAKQLELTYGPPTATADLIQPGSLWDGQNEWTMAVAQKERVYEFVWQSSGDVVLPNNMKGIKLYVSGEGRSEGDVSVNFQFSNYSRCLDELRLMRSKAF